GRVRKCWAATRPGEPTDGPPPCVAAGPRIGVRGSLTRPSVSSIELCFCRMRGSSPRIAHDGRSMDNALVVLAAGGTRGHPFPAEALSDALGRHGLRVHLATDERATRYAKAFPAATTPVLPTATAR